MIKPTPQIIKTYLKKWQTLENYRLQESSLSLLFQKLCPDNKKIENILLKVSALNDFYSTNIFDTYSVAKHILKSDIDSKLKGLDYSIVNKIAKVKIKNRTINFYSFATKYCSHHVDAMFPIYDSYVDKLLMHYKKQDKFFEFKKDDLKTYPKFVNIIKAFSSFYGLDEFSLKEIDQFLWQAGKEYFPKNYQRKQK